MFITRSFHHKRVLCLPSYYRVNKSVCHGSPYPPIYLEAPVCYFRTNHYFLTQIQENKRVEPIEVPKLNIDDVNKQLAKPSLWARVKKEIIHYYHGFRLLGLEVRIASGICFRVLRGHTLTRRERKQLVRTVADIIRLVPFAVFIIVPFMELLLPFYLKFFPFMLPSTFKEKSSEANAIQQRLKAKLELTRFLQETMLQTTGASKGDPDTPSVVEFQDFIKQVSTCLAKDITRFSKLFEDQVTLESLDNKQLRMLCQLLSLPTMGPSHLLRFQIWMRVRQLKAEDRLIAKEGVDKIPPWELQTLCQERGMRSVGLPKERLQSQLVEWLDLHLKQNVPLTLLLFSRALHVSQATIDQNPLQQVSVFDLTMSLNFTSVELETFISGCKFKTKILSRILSLVSQYNSNGICVYISLYVEYPVEESCRNLMNSLNLALLTFVACFELFN
ncbi:unnamed protein product [Trichobilharzia regenti]|nr:unnamed protein product [Trichobilharzia regenti]